MTTMAKHAAKNARMANPPNRRVATPQSSSFRWRGGRFAPQFAGSSAQVLLFQLRPKTVMLFGPIEINGALTHCFECAFHADRADIDVPKHRGDEQHGDDAVNYLRKLHVGNRRPIEWKHQHIAADSDGSTADHNDPEDRLLPGIKAISRRMVFADNAAAALEPLDVDVIRNIAGQPHEKDQHDAERKGETKIVMSIFGGKRPGRERARTDQRQQHVFAEGDVEARERKNDETCRRHPMDEPLKRVEAHDIDARAASFDPHHTARQIEHDQHGEHSQYRNSADPMQPNLMELPPLAALRLLDDIRFHVGNASETLDPIELLEELLLLDRLRCGVDRSGLLRRKRRHGGADEKQDRGNEQLNPSREYRHDLSPLVCAGPNSSTAPLSGCDGLAVSGLPSPGARAVAALGHAVLVDLGDDLAIACEQRLGRAHFGAQWQLALGEAIGTVFLILH